MGFAARSTRKQSWPSSELVVRKSSQSTSRLKKTARYSDHTCARCIGVASDKHRSWGALQHRTVPDKVNDCSLRHAQNVDLAIVVCTENLNPDAVVMKSAKDRL
jgi:hypothetical protein